MKIESRDLDIRTLLSSGFYRIPRFQRPYSWEREHIQEFWEDIIQDSPDQYFIGSMVVYKVGPQLFGVVDGQQRLTTLTILLCAIRNLLGERGFDDLAKGVHALIERHNIDNEAVFVVSTESSFPYFQDRIQKWAEPSLQIEPLNEEVNLQSAFEQLTGLVQATVRAIELDPSVARSRLTDRVRDKLKSIRDAILNLSLIFVELDDEDDAYVIFETLNTRGKDLRLSDLVKNHLSKHLRSRNQQTDAAKVQWRTLIETIEGSPAPIETDTFLHHYWLSKHEYLPAKKLFKRLKREVTREKAKPFLQDIVSNARWYRAIHDVPYGAWTKQEKRIADALVALGVFRVVQPVPCVLALVREYKLSKKLRIPHVEDALVAIEKFHFAFTAVTSQRSSGGISQMYALHARQLWEAGDTQESVKVISELKKKLRQRIPSLEEFKALFPGIIYTATLSKQRRLVKYILSGLDRATAKASTTDYDLMTIEHIASQSQTSATLPEEVVGQIGNLLLVSEELNQKLRNKSVADKKKILAENGVLPKDIANEKSWGAAEIVARTESMARLAYEKVWKI